MQTLEEANILLVDDSRELLTILTDALHGAGFAHVACAQSVREAREAFARERPDIMVLDINLPDGDGFTLLGSCAPRRTCPRSSSPRATPTATGSSAWASARTTT